MPTSDFAVAVAVNSLGNDGHASFKELLLKA